MFEPVFLGKARLAQDVRFVGTPGIDWWAHHIKNTRAYLEASLAGDQAAQLKALAELWSAVLSWQKMLQSPTAGLLIGEHTALAKLLIDCYTLSEKGPCQDVATQALVRNVAEHAALFPRDPARFADLFGQHVQITGKYIDDLGTGNVSQFQTDYQTALSNGLVLGNFIDQTFFSGRG